MTGPPKDVAAILDLHVHSRYSPDAKGSIKELAAMARKKGLQGFVVSDHNTTTGWKEIKAAKIRDLLVVPGMEVSTAIGHCLAIGVREEIPRLLPLKDTIERIEAAGGVGVPSHPFRYFNGVKQKGLESVGKKLRAIEVFNARDWSNGTLNPRYEHYALHRHLGGTGGSDTHQIFEIGNGYTLFPEMPESTDDVVTMIRKQKTWGDGPGTPFRQLMLQQMKNVRLWAGRGFKPM